MAKIKIVRQLTFPLNFAIGVRMAADALVLSFSYIFVTLIQLLAQKKLMLLPIITQAILLTVIGLWVFTLSGFYTYGRAYRGRYKLLLVFLSTALTYGTFYFVVNSNRFLTILFSFCLTVIILSFLRVFLLLSHYFIKAEKKRARLLLKPIEQVLVIGGGGYIGSVLVRKLLQRGYKVHILDKFLYGKESVQDLKNLKILEGDFRHIDDLTAACEDCDAIIHLGAIVGDGACSVSNNLTIETNLLSTKFILQVAKSFSCQRLIFASTCSVYGAQKEGSQFSPLTEESSLAPVSLYARTKIDSERVILKEGGNGLSCTILRLATVYGNSYRPRFDLVINLLCATAVLEKKIVVFGGNQWRPFIYVGDVCDGIIRVLESPPSLVYQQIFNLGATKENYQLKEIGRIIKEIKDDAELIIKEDSIDLRDYYVSFEKVERVLGFKPRYEVRQGVLEMIEHFKKWVKGNDYHKECYSNHKTWQLLCKNKAVLEEWTNLTSTK